MDRYKLCDANCRVQQAQEVLSMWLESVTDNSEAKRIATILTLLHGVPEAIDEAETELSAYQMAKHRGGRRND